jgi:hypothetical protein
MEDDSDPGADRTFRSNRLAAGVPKRSILPENDGRGATVWRSHADWMGPAARPRPGRGIRLGKPPVVPLEMAAR